VPATGAVAASGFLMASKPGRRLVLKCLWPALPKRGTLNCGGWPQSAQLAQLFLGSFLVTTIYTVAMIASLHAFDADIAFTSAAFVYLAGSAVAAAVPTPGGVGATEAALAAGYTAVGLPAEVAVSAVLLFRFITFWIPILPGWPSRECSARASLGTRPILLVGSSLPE